MIDPTVNIAPEALGELLDGYYEATRDNEIHAEMLADANAKIANLTADVKAFRGSSILYAIALVVSIIAHILRSAL